MPNFISKFSTKEQTLLLVLIILLFVVLIILGKDFIWPKYFKKEMIPELKPPQFLISPLPSIEKIKEALNNPKFDELKFYQLKLEEKEEEVSKPESLEELIKKVKVEKMGRPNPFIPFEE
jgi:hypothetical protein